jgi:Ca2+-binding RTX toxin-like protein
MWPSHHRRADTSLYSSWGQLDDDRLRAGADDDRLRGDAGRDRCRGGTGANTATSCEIAADRSEPHWPSGRVCLVGVA